jgi:hypothetical protein
LTADGQNYRCGNEAEEKIVEKRVEKRDIGISKSAGNQTQPEPPEKDVLAHIEQGKLYGAEYYQPICLCCWFFYSYIFFHLIYIKFFPLILYKIYFF